MLVLIDSAKQLAVIVKNQQEQRIRRSRLGPMSKYNFVSPVPAYSNDSKLHKVLVSHTEDFSH